jgi:hypothetical protein
MPIARLACLQALLLVCANAPSLPNAVRCCSCLLHTPGHPSRGLHSFPLQLLLLLTLLLPLPLLLLLLPLLLLPLRTSEDAATDGHVASEWALLVNVGACTGHHERTQPQRKAQTVDTRLRKDQKTRDTLLQ